VWWPKARSAREDRGVLVSLMVDRTLVRTTDLVQAVVAEVAGTEKTELWWCCGGALQRLGVPPRDGQKRGEDGVHGGAVAWCRFRRGQVRWRWRLKMVGGCHG